MRCLFNMELWGLNQIGECQYRRKKRERSTPSAIIKKISTIIYEMLTSLSVLIGLRNELAET